MRLRGYLYCRMLHLRPADGIYMNEFDYNHKTDEMAFALILLQIQSNVIRQICAFVYHAFQNVVWFC